VSNKYIMYKVSYNRQSSVISTTVFDWKDCHMTAIAKFREFLINTSLLWLCTNLAIVIFVILVVCILTLISKLQTWLLCGLLWSPKFWHKSSSTNHNSVVRAGIKAPKFCHTTPVLKCILGKISERECTETKFALPLNLLRPINLSRLVSTHRCSAPSQYSFLICSHHLLDYYHLSLQWAQLVQRLCDTQPCHWKTWQFMSVWTELHDI